MNYQSEKQIVLKFQRDVDHASPDSILDALQAHLATDFVWRGVYPFDGLKTPEDVAKTFWRSLKASITGLHRREDIFFAGANEIDGGKSVWVISMGHFVGLFDQPWLGIRPSGKLSFLRYCSFYRVDYGKISQMVMHLDIPHLMAQAGQNPFPGQAGAQIVQPAPLTRDGVLRQIQSVKEGERTLQKINDMIGNLGQWKSGLPLEEELALDWHHDMAWYGPTGIGATYTIERYVRQHCGPFRAAFTDRSSTGHIARLAEGHYGGFFGWPNFTARLKGAYLGLPPSDKTGEFRVIDLYRRCGDKLAENWVFIDLLYFFKTQGRTLL